MTKNKITSINAPRDLLAQVAELGLEQERSVSYMFVVAMREYLKGKVKPKKKAKEPEPVQQTILPPFVDIILWNEYIKARKKKKYSVSQEVQNRLINTLITFHDDGIDIDQVMKDSISGNYRDFYKPKGGLNGGSSQQSNQERIERGMQFRY